MYKKTLFRIHKRQKRGDNFSPFDLPLGEKLTKEKIIMKLKLFSLSLCMLGIIGGACSSESDPELTAPKEVQEEAPEVITYSVRIPTEGNSWIVGHPAQTKQMVSKGGIHNWTKSESVVSTFFYATKTGEIKLGLKAKFPSNSTTLKVTVGETSKSVTFEKASSYKDYFVGKFNVKTKGYQRVDIQGIAKDGGYYADLSEVLISGNEWTSSVSCIGPDYFYWGRRGPSVHLNYQIPTAVKKVNYFYNEITVPEGEDPIGSYFCSSGFGQGYFGIQVNSETERRVLFSVWSAYDTQDPNQIPDDYQVNELAHGEGVHVGKFGNEGSGAQSFLKFNWKAGTTYKFLLKAEPQGNEKTDFTAWFYAPEEGEWKLIASFRRPYTDTYLTGMYSFLENFVTEMGDITRKGFYTNQWMYDADSKSWVESVNASFTCDQTGRSGHRLDYYGGVENGKYFLQNCGFINNQGTYGEKLTRPAVGKAPNIDFSKLPL
ncbi:DUF3472 domain-containing protein [Puteibacter caeruleilacunae]|nr:DUF3472 domain-containing protein [Puteibacter caeruleilacunae]